MALWLDDELEGEELASFESWVSGQPEYIAAREETRRWRSLIASAIPAAEEPPYPDFFNSRISQAIRDQTPKSAIPEKKSRSIWQAFLMPLAACAGMALAFWVGKKSQSTPEIDVAGAPRAIPVEQLVYTPESGVKAESFSSNKASAMVIVLNGVRAIPDSTDFSATTYVPISREIDSTAEADSMFEEAVDP
jgi:hypothetical protein